MVEIPEHLRHHMTDSAGQPWAGRTFSDNPWKDDDGSAPPALESALRAFRGGEAPSAAVIDALRDSRVLIPLVAELGEQGVTETGHIVDKSAELSIVTVQAPDGRGIVPIFSSAEAMRRWDPQARPVPADARRAALAAAAEGAELLILDPANPETEFVVRRPAAWAIAQGTDYVEPWRDAQVHAAAGELLKDFPELVGIDLRPGDPQARFAGAELTVVALVPVEAGAAPEKDAVDRILRRLGEHLGAPEQFVERVDSIAIAAELVAVGENPSQSRGKSSRESSSRRGLWGRKRD